MANILHLVGFVHQMEKGADVPARGILPCVVTNGVCAEQELC